MRKATVVTTVHITNANIAINTFITIIRGELYLKFQKSILLVNTILG